MASGFASTVPEKTLADCFKYRNKLGLDVFLEALKLYLARKTAPHRRTDEIRTRLQSGKADASVLGSSTVLPIEQFDYAGLIMLKDPHKMDW